MVGRTSFWSKVDINPEGCWLWTGWIGDQGYGLIDDRAYSGHVLRAHRVAYEMRIGPIPEGFQLDHLCRVRHCVRPDHLEVVTNRENTVRGAHGSLVTHCPAGHDYDQVNTYIDPEGHRRCRACHRERMREQYREDTQQRYG
jgi:hypothetical protein